MIQMLTTGFYQMLTPFYIVANQTDAGDMADVEIQPIAYQTKQAAKQALNHLAQAHLADHQKNPDYADAELEIDPELDPAKDMSGIISPQTGLIETFWLTEITNID